MEDTRRAYMWHGTLMVLLALITGIFVANVRNPRLALSAHTGGVLNGILVFVFALAWREVRLSARLQAITYWSAIVGGYLNWASLLLGGIFGTSQSTPIAGAGFSGSAAQEALVATGLTVGGIASLLSVVLLLYGLRGPARE